MNVKKEIKEKFNEMINKKIWVGVQTNIGIGKPPGSGVLKTILYDKEEIVLKLETHKKEIKEYKIPSHCLKKVTLHANGKGLSCHMDSNSWISVSFH